MPPRTALVALFAVSILLTACAAPPPDFRTYRLGDPPAATRNSRNARAQKRPVQPTQKERTGAVATRRRSPQVQAQRDSLVRGWLYKPQPSPARRGVVQGSRTRSQPVAQSRGRTSPSTRAVVQHSRTRQQGAAPGRRVVVQHSRTRQQPAPAPNKRAVFQQRTPARATPGGRIAAAFSRTQPAPASARQQPLSRRDRPERAHGREGAAGQYPVAKKSSQDGYVVSPYTRAKINVKRVPRGAQVLDPSSERVFINP